MIILGLNLNPEMYIHVHRVNKNAESVLRMSDDGSVKDSKAMFMDD